VRGAPAGRARPRRRGGAVGARLGVAQRGGVGVAALPQARDVDRPDLLAHLRQALGEALAAVASIASKTPRLSRQSDRLWPM